MSSSGPRPGGRRPGAGPEHGRRRDILEREATARGHLLRTLEPAQRVHRGVHDVDGVVRAKRLGQDVVDPGALQHGAHRAARDNPGTGAGRAQHDHTGRLLALDRVRDGALNAGHLEEALLGLLDTLGDRRGHLLGLAVAHTHGALAVADHDQGGEAEPPTALHDLGDPVDVHHALDELALLRGPTATVVTTVSAVTAAGTPGTTLAGAATATALRSGH